jgi:chromosome partitioning protein
MRVVAIASQKGGSGKSTITIHLAALAELQGIKTLIADMDEHSQTSTEWGKMREQSTPLVARVPLDKLEGMLVQAKEKGFELVLLDLPPFVNEVVQEVTKRADLTLVPTRPFFPDMRTLPRIIKQIHPPFSVILNACPPGNNNQESSKTSNARKLLDKNMVPVCPVSITQRVALTDALNGGESVNEFDPQSKAATEIKKLLAWVNAETQK